jgi:hypothetical protein
MRTESENRGRQGAGGNGEGRATRNVWREPTRSDTADATLPPTTNADCTWDTEPSLVYAPSTWPFAADPRDSNWNRQRWPTQARKHTWWGVPPTLAAKQHKDTSHTPTHATHATPGPPHRTLDMAADLPTPSRNLPTSCSRMRAAVAAFHTAEDALTCSSNRCTTLHPKHHPASRRGQGEDAVEGHTQPAHS